MNDVWQRYLDDIGAARGIAPGEISASIEQLPQRLTAQHGDLGKLALSENLVDALKTQDQERDLLIESGVADEENHSFRQIDLESYLDFVKRKNQPIGLKEKTHMQ